ncbi:pro-adrenomedullin [Protopterus annectens]|uniref:pro-adrenomedullin n=1 Tax=Protopterus annectens TaxID=7888 RepID=UPI001CF9DEEF|nr:pro-adrenomedullin [Protopterus annectens]
MRVDQILFLHLSHMIVLFLTTQAAVLRLTDSSELQKRMSFWNLIRTKRALEPYERNKIQDMEGKARQFVGDEDVKDNGLSKVSLPDNHVRVKRYRQSDSGSQKHHTGPGCKFGTCAVHNLAYRVHQTATDKDKEISPASKISPQGYGRKRRSLQENGAFTQLESRLRAIWNERRNALSAQRSGVVTDLRKPWDTLLLRT